MISRRIAIPLAAAGLCALSSAAQAGEAPRAPHRAARAKAHPRTSAAPATGGGAGRTAPLASGDAAEDRASSLERRRRAFFAPKPDEGGTAPDGAPSVGVTLGGSGGVSPGMGFKF